MEGGLAEEEGIVEDSKVFAKLKATEEEVIRSFRQALEKEIISIERYYNPYPTLLLILERLDFRTIMKLKPIVDAYSAKNAHLPVLFTKEEITRAVDVFPIEFLSIQQTAEHLYGEKIISRIQFNRNMMRKQLEFELRSKLIHLREHILGVPKEQQFKELLLTIFPNMLPLCRAMIYLRGKRIEDTEEMIVGCGKFYSIDTSVLKDLLVLARNPRKMSNQEAEQYLHKSVQFLEEIILVIDRLSKHSKAI